MPSTFAPRVRGHDRAGVGIDVASWSRGTADSRSSSSATPARWLAVPCVTERTIATWSSTPASRGRCSQIWMPGTLVAMGRNSPRISAGASRLEIIQIDVAGPAPHEDMDHGRRVVTAATCWRFRGLSRLGLAAKIIGQRQPAPCQRTDAQPGAPREAMIAERGRIVIGEHRLESQANFRHAARHIIRCADGACIVAIVKRASQRNQHFQPGRLASVGGPRMRFLVRKGRLQ